MRHLRYVGTTQKQPCRAVLRKRCFQIYRRTPMPKCDFNKVVLYFDALGYLDHYEHLDHFRNLGTWALRHFKHFGYLGHLKFLRTLNSADPALSLQEKCNNKKMNFCV